ncbi:hypothetical protein [uncultured Flavobacterium sp.]|uniref:hypothetical protein n=1 Tax=uncultured Flavobacterium sp. TaxID=165435 RepID=UPI0027E0881D|nr:hypothetical protein [uncultured Flavobacterium sp.]
MNKMEIIKQRALLVINFILIGLFLSCSSKQERNNSSKNDDYMIVTKIFETSKRNSKSKTIHLQKSNNNEYVIKVLKSERAKSSLKNPEQIDDDFITTNHNEESLKRIFNYKEYEFLVSQSVNSTWDADFIEQITGSNKTDYSSLKEITISKPVYTSNHKYALVSITEKTRMGIQIMEKTNGKWIEKEIIAPLIFQPKATLFKN